MEINQQPISISLAEDLEETSGPISYLLNRNGRRIVGCSTQGTYNLFTTLNLLPCEKNKMDFILEIRAGIRENINTQEANIRDIMTFIASTPKLDSKYEGFLPTEEMEAIVIIKKLTTHVALLASVGINQSTNNQGHFGCLHVFNGHLFLDGTELDAELFCNFLYSSSNNQLWWFKK